MKLVFGICLIFCSLNSYSQLSSIYAEGVRIDAFPVIRGDSIAFDVKVINTRSTSILCPYSMGKLHHEISFLGRVLNMRIGISSSFAGIPLEFSYRLKQVAANETIGSRTRFIKNEQKSEFLLSFDFITIDDFLKATGRSYDEYNPAIKGSEYAEYIHIFYSTSSDRYNSQ
jgi:hypothetical protein